MLNLDLNEQVRLMQLYLSKSEGYGDVTVKVTDEGDDFALLEVEEKQVYIELRAEEEEVGIAKRLVKRIYYYPGYWAEESGGYFEPPEVVEHELMACSNLIEACVELHSLMYRYMIESMAETISTSNEYETILDLQEAVE